MAETPRFELSTYEKAQAQLRKNNLTSPALDQQITEAKIKLQQKEAIDKKRDQTSATTILDKFSLSSKMDQSEEKSKLGLDLLKQANSIIQSSPTKPNTQNGTQINLELQLAGLYQANPSGYPVLRQELISTLTRSRDASREGQYTDDYARKQKADINASEAAVLLSNVERLDVSYLEALNRTPKNPISPVNADEKMEVQNKGKKESVKNKLIPENKIREIFGIKPEQKMDERLKSITQETLNAISKRGMKMVSYSDDARAGGITYSMNITEKGSPSPKAYEGKILFKYQDRDLNKELIKVSKIPETELKFESIDNHPTIQAISDKAVYLKDGIFAMGEDGNITQKNQLSIGNDLEIYDYVLNGSTLVVALYNIDTMDRSKRTLVVGADGSILADGKVVARKRNTKEQGIINATIDVENKKSSLGDILPKSKNKLGQEGNLKIDPTNVAILQRAEAAGFTFADSNSRTNSINIYDKSGTKIGNIITMYGQGQKALIEFLTKTVK